ncbi:type IV secretory system conjugative DNA transfer family protein [Oscillospiraceae bacterium 44-34]
MKPDVKKIIITNLPYLLFVWLFGKMGEAWRLAAGADASQKMLHFMDSLAAAFANGLPSLHTFDLCIGIAGAVLVRLAVYMKGKNAKKYRHGMEYGSARFGNAKDIAPYIDPVFENNILLTQTERLTMNGRPKDPKTARNKNVLVIGGSGSGKTRFFVKPSLMQMHSSYVVTDPKGSLLIEVGQLLKRGGYRIKVLNTINFSKSMRYNPFAYLHSEKDILKLVNTIIANTKGDGEKSAEDFWVKSERLFYTALIGYIWYEAPENEKNFTTLLEMINASEAREDDAEFQSPVDEMFARLAEKEPEHFAVRQYQKFLLSAGKTRSSILISCGARLAPFDIREVRELMETDEMELDTLGDRKTALFLIMSDTDTTFNFILAMLQSQLINLLCDRADDVYGGRLPVHVRLILDEFANIGQIPNFDKLIATIRSREISASIILQSQSQLKSIYKDAADIISDNCDCTLFLSGRGKNAKEISDALGRETIDSYNTSENRGSQTSHGLNYQKLGKELMSQDEIAVMDGGKCILQIRGVRPFFSEKYDITRHPQYKYLSDADKKNAFDVDGYLAAMRRRQRQVVTQEEVFDFYEIDLSDEEETGEADAAEE